MVIVSIVHLHVACDATTNAHQNVAPIKHSLLYLLGDVNRIVIQDVEDATTCGE